MSGGVAYPNYKLIIFILPNIGLIKVVFRVAKVYITVLNNCLLFKGGAVFTPAYYFLRLPCYMFRVMVRFEVFYPVRGPFIILLTSFILKVYSFIIFVYKKGAHIISYLLIRVIIIIIVIINSNNRD